MKYSFAACLLIALFCLTIPAMAQDTAAPATAAATAPVAAPAPASAPVTAPVTASGPESAAPVIKMVDLPDAVLTPPAPKPKNKIFVFFDDFFSKISGKTGEPDPTGTLIAPFEPDTKPFTNPAERVLNPLPVNAGSLERAHRSSSDLAAWLQQAIPETLSFNTDTYQSHLNTLGRGFSAAALAEYNTWVTATGILESLTNNSMQLNGFVTDTPFLLNEGVVAGRYRWLFEIPVMVSFVPRDTRDYRGKNNVDTRRLIITLQLGRVVMSSLPDNVMIETWSVRDNLRKN